MFWSGAKLRAKLGNIVENFDPRRIESAAYALSVGSEVYISPTEVHSASDVMSLDDGGSFNIPPGQFAFLLSEEHISLPNDVLGFINMKSMIKLRGLVNVSGFHVDPGYSGKLVFAVFNAGPRPVAVRRGDACFLLWLADLAPNPNSKRKAAEFSEFARKKGGFDHIGSALVSNMGGSVISLYSLNEKIEKMQASAEKWVIYLSVASSILTALIVAFANKLFWS